MPTLALTVRRRPDGRRDALGADRVEHVAGDALGRLAPAVGQQDGELVAAEARDHVALAQAAAQRVGHLADQRVAGAVPERVVDVLEVVDVEQHGGAAGAVALDVVHVALELALEGPPVEQAGQRIVVRHEAQLLLVAAALGDVLHLAEEVQRQAVGVVHQRRAQGDPHDLALVVEEAHLAADGRRVALEHALVLVAFGLAVLRVQERAERAALEVGALVAGDLAQRAVRAQQAAVGARDRHADVTLLERRAEALLGLGERALGLDAIVDVAHDGMALQHLAGRPVAHDAQLGLDPDVAAVAAAQPERARDVVGLARAVADRDEHRQVVGVHEILGAAADQLLGLVAEQLTARGRDVAEGAVGAMEGEDVGRGLRHLQRPLLGGAQRRLGAVALGLLNVEQLKRVRLLAHGVDAQHGERETGAHEPHGDDQRLAGAVERQGRQRGDRGQATARRDQTPPWQAASGTSGVPRVHAGLVSAAGPGI